MRPGATTLAVFRARLMACDTNATIASSPPAFDQQCEEGYRGPICDLCEANYTRQSGACQYCPGFNAANVAGVVVLMLFVIALLAFLYRRRHAAWMHGVVLKITLTFFEMIAILEETFDVKWPTTYSAITAQIRAALASVVELSALACATHINRFAHLAIWTLGMLFVLAVFYALFRRHAKRAAHVERARLRQKWLERGFYLLFAGYPLVSPVVISIFICREIAGTPYLVADFTLHCEGTQWALATAWAALWTVFFVVGFPITLLHALRQRWTVVNFIAKEYKRTGVARYWEVIDFGKKLFLSSLVLFFPEGTTTRISVAVLVAGIALVALVWYRPFHHSIHNRLDFAASGALVLTYFVGLMMKVNPAASQHVAFSVILILLLVGVLVAATVGVVLARRGVREVARHSKHGSPPGGVGPGDHGRVSTEPLLPFVEVEDVDKRDGDGGGSDDGSVSAVRTELELAKDQAQQAQQQAQQQARQHAAELEAAQAETARQQEVARQKGEAMRQKDEAMRQKDEEVTRLREELTQLRKRSSRGVWRKE
eukprot:g7431.t1